MRAESPADGAEASLAVLSRVVRMCRLRSAGGPARVLFAGLTPGTIGLYQVNVEIPQDAPTGGCSGGGDHAERRGVECGDDCGAVERRRLKATRASRSRRRRAKGAYGLFFELLLGKLVGDVVDDLRIGAEAFVTAEL